MAVDGTTELLTAAIEANLHAFSTSQFARWSQIEGHDEAHLLWFMHDGASPMFNTVHRARLSADDAVRTISELQARYAARHLPILWWVGPSSTPLDLSRHLISAGFVPAGETIGMAIDLQNLGDRPQPLNLAIEAVKNGDSLVTFARTLCQGFQTPPAIAKHVIEQMLSLGYGPEAPLLHYVGRLDGAPVATSSLFVDTGVAGIYNVAVIPAVRHRGVGTAVTTAPLLEAASRGCRYAVLHASATTRPMYQQLGFDTYCYFHKYLWPASTRNSHR